jgi:hypothetical protein
LTVASEAGESEKHTFEDVASIYGSAAPSVLSAQWYRSPQERLNIGPRVSRAENTPWDLGDEETDPNVEQAKSRFPQRPRLGSVLGVLPGRAPSRMNDDQQSHSPPRSPLLTDGFLSNVKAGLPKDDPSILPPAPAPDPGARPSTSMKSYSDSSQSNANSKKIKKEKKKKESSRPTMKELWGAYKGKLRRR